MLSNNKIHEDAYHAVNDFSTQKVPDYTGLVVQDEKYVWVPSLIIIIIIEPMILDECYLTNLFLSAERFSDLISLKWSCFWSSAKIHKCNCWEFSMSWTHHKLYWVCGTGLSRLLSHLHLFCGQWPVIDPIFWGNLIGSFSNDDGNIKEKLVWKSTFAELRLFCDYSIIFEFHNVVELYLMERRLSKYRELIKELPRRNFMLTLSSKP